MNNGQYNNLIAQLDRLAKHNRQGSLLTKRRYYEAMQRFCRFLAENYHLQKLRNIRDEHFEEYILSMKDSGKSASTVKTDISAIRFFHDLMPDARYQLPRNAELKIKLERRKFGGVDRSWSDDEYARFCAAGAEAGHPEYADAAALAYYAGLRIHECFRIDTAMADKAIRSDHLIIKGKGGKVRTVHLRKEAIDALIRARARVPRGEKLFVPHDEETHISIGKLQQFIASNREALADRNRESRLTFHGLRHSYAERLYTTLIKLGSSELDARKAVSEALGHNRPDVTRIYLAGAM